MACDLCGSTEYEVIWDKEERDKQGKLQSVTIPGHIHSRNVMCKKCGLVYVEPKMSRGDLNWFYREAYRAIYGGGANNTQAEKRHAETAYKLIPNDAILSRKHLDIGCSTGELLTLTGGCGIEPNKDHYEISINRGLNVANTTLEEYHNNEQFNTITMLNALEHVYSPTEVLTKINSLLTTNGYLLVSVPNIYNTTINLPVDAFLSNAHLYNFSVETLETLFNKCGFKVVERVDVQEEIGDKLYFLGQKADIKCTIPSLIGHEIEAMRTHLSAAQQVFQMKMAIKQASFR